MMSDQPKFLHRFTFPDEFGWLALSSLSLPYPQHGLPDHHVGHIDGPNLNCFAGHFISFTNPPPARGLLLKNECFTNAIKLVH